LKNESENVLGTLFELEVIKFKKNMKSLTFHCFFVDEDEE
jgi:hypothetical protein